MGMMDNLTGSKDNMRARYDQLCRMEKDGSLSNDDQMELDRLRPQFE